MAESLLSSDLLLFATPSPMLPLKAQVDGSSTETGLRKRRRTGKEAEQRGELPQGGGGRGGHLATVAGSGAPQRARWPRDWGRRVGSGVFVALLAD